MLPDDKAKELGIDLAAYPGLQNLNPAARSGNMLYVSGHVSTGYNGKLGKDLTTEQGQAAARVSAVQILQAVYKQNGTLNNLRCVKVLGAVNSAPEFTEQHLVVNGASQLFWDIFGKETRGYHARSALGFVSLPLGAAVEVEAIFEVMDE